MKKHLYDLKHKKALPMRQYLITNTSLKLGPVSIKRNIKRVEKQATEPVEKFASHIKAKYPEYTNNFFNFLKYKSQ